MTGTPKPPARRTSQRRQAETPAPGELLRAGELAESLGREQTATDVRTELEGLMAALREANGHLITANLRSQTLAEQMNQLYEEARSAIEAKDEFFTVISHELRTPLTSITGWADLLKSDPDAATVAEAARAIASSAALQAHLIDDLLDVSRIMTNKFAITKASVDLRNVINESVSGMRPLAAAKDISLRTNAQQSVVIDGDASRLRQVLTNLLTNALKFTPAGGLIETRLFRDGSFAVIQVSDTGEGIAAQFLPHVFDRRAQATERRFAGLGLGLAIVKHIVELHGGSVAAASDGEGKGSTFTIRLPSAP
jgi:signal transduction histidine kinase